VGPWNSSKYRDLGFLPLFVWGHGAPQSIEIASTLTFPSSPLAGYLKNPEALKDNCCIIGSVPDFLPVVGTSLPQLNG
jgi:hypothetical protein